MTICAGFKSEFGVVLCADSQETFGVMKFDAPKLVIMPDLGSPDDRVRMAFAGAGDGPFIDKLVEKMWEAAQCATGTSMQEVMERVEDANIEWHKKIWQAFGDSHRPEAEILISIYTAHRVNLYKASGPIISEVNSYAFAGIGGELGSFLTEHFRGDHFDNIEDDVSVCLYILENVKKYVDSCGGDTQLAALMIDGSIQRMASFDARVVAEGIRTIADELFYLFSLARDLRFRKEDLDQSAKEVVRSIHATRAELRKRIKGTIRVSSRLQKAMRAPAVYRKIEWPPTEASSAFISNLINMSGKEKCPRD
jgi:hypothetical protein